MTRPRLHASRPLTGGERAIVASLFGAAIDCDAVTVNRRRWWPFQPREVLMAPDGHLWLHPQSSAWREDYSTAALPLRALFAHEMTHVWQAQRRGRWWLPLMRHPFCRYRYRVKPGRPLDRYGIEQQAEIVADAYLARERGSPREELEALLTTARNQSPRSS